MTKKIIFYFLFSVEMLKKYLPHLKNIYVIDNHNINKTYSVFYVSGTIKSTLY